MKQIYERPCMTETSLTVPRPIMVGGSIEDMNYGTTNPFGDDDDAKQRENKSDYESPKIQNSLW